MTTTSKISSLVYALLCIGSVALCVTLANPTLQAVAGGFSVGFLFLMCWSARSLLQGD